MSVSKWHPFFSDIDCLSYASQILTMCKRNLETAELFKECCYGHQFNGTHCYICADGYTGQKCETPCDGLFYGYLCSNSCECPKKHCHHIYGCRANENVGSSMAVYTTGSLESSEATTSYPTDSTSFGVNTRKESQTTGKHYEITNSIFSNVSEEFQSSRVIISSVPPVTTSPNLLGNNTLIIAIGGLIAFFLCILSIQACVKLYACIRRKTKSKRITEKTESAIDEETYEDINETMMTAMGKAKEPKQQGKYDQLKTINNDTSMLYHKIDNTLERRSAENLNIEIKGELHSSLIRYDSTCSSDSYLKPGTNKHEKHNYIEILETASTNDELVKDCIGVPDHDASCSNYLEPTHSQHLDENGQNSRVQRDSTYQDVINEKSLDDTYLDVVHCIETGNNP